MKSEERDVLKRRAAMALARGEQVTLEAEQLADLIEDSEMLEEQRSDAPAES